MTATLSWNRRILKTLNIQFLTVVLVVEIDEPTTEKISECGAKETQLSLILVIIVSCLIFPTRIAERRFLTGLQRGYFFLRGGGGYTHSGYHKTLSTTIACDRISCETET